MARPTIRDVAQRAGVGIGTVSRVLNQSPAVRPKTRERVLQAIAELGYYPDERARELRLKRGNLLLVLVPHLTKPLYIEVLRHIERLRPPGIVLTVTNAESPEEKERAFQRIARDTRIGGIIAVNLAPPEGFAHILRPGVPLIVVDTRSEEFPTVEVDHVHGGYLATQHFIRLGHERIGFIGRFQDPFVPRGQRIIGYRRALEEAGIPFRREYVRISNYDHRDSCEHALVLLDLPEPPTAIFAASDLQAMGVLEAARLRGLRVPQDLAVLGYNDVEWAEFLGLSTIRLPLDQLAEHAIALLLQSWSGAAVTPPPPLKPTLVVRQTCGGTPTPLAEER